MTSDTEHNDPTKDDGLDKRKEFFEKGLSALLADEHFFLLYVPDNGAKMQVIRPATNSYHRQRMIKKMNEAKDIPSFYYALSHLWGVTKEKRSFRRALSHLWGVTKEDRYSWNDISEYVIDEEGQPVKPVPMRPEKRDALLALLKDHPDSYWWIDVLCARVDTPLDIMGDIYGCCLECIAMIDCDPSLISKLHTKRNIKTLDEERVTGDLIEEFRQLVEEYPHFIDHICTFVQSKWWQRVWTWQEMALPFEVRFMSETDTQRLPWDTITMDDLINSSDNAERIDLLYFSDFNQLCQKTHNFRAWSSEIKQARNFNKRRFGKMDSLDFVNLIGSWRTSNRQCMDPADYVYGVLGMLQIKIPRLKNPYDVWERFLYELEDFMKTTGLDDFGGGQTLRISIFAHHFDICEAENMSDVYRKLLQ